MNDEKRVACAKCGKTFGSATLLRTHKCSVNVNVLSGSWMKYNNGGAKNASGPGSAAAKSRTTVRVGRRMRAGGSSSSQTTQDKASTSSASSGSGGGTRNSSSSSSRHKGRRMWTGREQPATAGEGVNAVWQGSESAQLVRHQTIAVAPSGATVAERRRGEGVERHRGGEQWTCGACGKRFGRSDTLRRHQQMMHTRDSVQCNDTLCAQPFPSAQALRRHQREVHQRGAAHAPFACDVCTASFRSQSRLTEHKKIAHDQLHAHALYSLSSLSPSR